MNRSRSQSPMPEMCLVLRLDGAASAAESLSVLVKGCGAAEA
jgi:hypothetical protein